MGRSDKPRYGKLALEDEERLTAGIAHHRGPAWSRDGRTLAFSVGAERDASYVVTDRRGRIARTLEGPACGAPAFSPGGAVAFTRRFGATREIWLSAGGDAPAVRLLGGDGSSYFDPAFSPDGATLACAVEPPKGRSHLMLLDVASGHRSTLGSSEGRADSRPAFSPLGDELIFEGASAGSVPGMADHALYALHLVQNQLARLTTSEERAGRPTVIDAGLVVYERTPANDATAQAALALLDRRRGRSHTIVDDALRRADPACFVDEEGKVKLAYVVLLGPKVATGLPRYELYTARLRGVSRHGAVRSARDEAEPAEALS